MMDFFKIFKPLFFEEDKLSISKFWLTIIMSHSCYIWFILNKDIQNTTFQVLMLLLTYMLTSKAVIQSKSSFDNWVNTKQTAELMKYKVQSSQAAKNVDSEVG